MSELLAKSPQGGRRLTLLQHTIDVMDAAEWLFGIPGEPTRLGLAWMRFFRIAKDRFPVFHINLLASAAFHDWGKANDGMQKLLAGQGKQVIRHEHLSGLLLTLDTVCGWLTHRPQLAIDQDIVVAATISHHLKADLQNFGQPPRPGLGFQVYTDHRDFGQMLELAAGRLGLQPPVPKFTTENNWGYRDIKAPLPKGVFNVDPLLARLKDFRLAPFKKKLRKDEARRRMLWSVRAALIAADAAASGLRREDLPLETWIREVFDEQRLCTKSFIWSEVIDNRIDELILLGKWPKDDRDKGWTDFQRECDTLPSRALLLAPCGSGKTLAAWRWIAAQLKERPAARVIFLYPTRATAKEGFRDYVSWAPEADAALMHGTSAFDLQGMFANPDDPDDPRKESEYEVDRRLYALGYWTRRVFSATVDQFLAFLQYAYGPVCMLPVLADSVLVIDEVHSFDHSMLSALKGFLQTFDLPVLCMTATLREEQQEELVNECGLTRYNERPGELNEIASAPRYRLRRTNEGAVLNIVRDAIAEKKRVLWVVNQVKRAQRAYLSCRKLEFGIPLVCYHSRFRLQDRRSRHEEVVKAFRADSPPALAITSQVCEMSLDMDADLLITEYCPISSLIQRMGRCHRDRKLRSNAGDVWIYQPLDHDGEPDLKPYDEDALTGIEGFLTRLEQKRISQMDLENALAEAPSPPARVDELSSFLKSGPYAMGGMEDFRDIDDFTVSAVLAMDVPQFVGLQSAKQPTDGLIVPVPRRLGRERDPCLPGYLALANDQHYHPLIGFCDQPVREMGGLE
jgi:CRISPR-associated endonuclease/helicase Cas3